MFIGGAMKRTEVERTTCVSSGTLPYGSAIVILDKIMTQDIGSPAAGAAAALAGYEYQLNVSVLAALRLMLINNTANAITLEPANEEDLEVDLAPGVPGRVVSTGTVSGGFRLIIQVKLSSGEPWSIQDFDRLMNHGDARRPARQHLDDLDNRYLLVTNGGVKGRARDLLVSDFEEMSGSSNFPSSLRKTLRNKPEGRVAIWANLTERQLEFEINHILSVVLRIPYPQHEGCRKALREEARERMRGTLLGVWNKADLLSMVRVHGGYLAGLEELECFVQPSNFEDMTSRFRSRNAIVIAGSSGTGKTCAALALCDAARRRDGALNVVTITPSDGPAAVRRLVGNGPTLFYVEDPWGQYSLQPQAESWAEQLPRLLRSANPSQQFVITTRHDMLRQTEGDSHFKPWMIELNAEHYRDGELEIIYEKRMGSLPPNRQGAALEFRDRALERLETPLELDLFFSGILDGPTEEEHGQSFLYRVLRNAHRNAVADVVAKYLKAIGDIRVAATIWALLVRGGFTRQEVARLHRPMRRREPRFVDLVDKSIDRLIATRHLRQPSRGISFAHPSVREGFEKYLRCDWWQTVVALESVLATLTDLDEPDCTWGIETAARIVQAASELAAFSGREFEPPESVSDAIDAWLAHALVDKGARFSDLVHLAAKVGSARSIPSELARWFLAQTQPFPFADEENEEQDSVEYDDAWYCRVRQDPVSSVIAGNLVRKLLLQESHCIERDFLGKLDRISTDLTPHFLAAAEAAADSGLTPFIEVVAAGAVRDIANYERVLDKALDVLALEWTISEETNAKFHASNDGELSAAETVDMQDFLETAGGTAQQLIRTYIVARRQEGAWREIAKHPRVMQLRNFWAEQVDRSTLNVPSDEIETLLDITLGSADETTAWCAASRFWSEGLRSRLATRINDGVKQWKLRAVLARCAYDNARDLLRDQLRTTSIEPSERVSMLIDLHNLTLIPDVVLDVDAIVDDTDAREILAAFAAGDASRRTIGHSALSLLEASIRCDSVTVLAKVVPVLISNGRYPREAIGRWITSSTEGSEAVAATNAAIEAGDDGLVELTLSHARADARAAALTYFSAKHASPLPRQLLELAHDRSSRVRLALIRALRGREHPMHLPVLLELTKDSWSDAEPFDDEPVRFAVARAALAALSAHSSLPVSLVPDLLLVASISTDTKVSRLALRVVARKCGVDGRRALWRLVTNNHAQPRPAAILVALSHAPTVESELTDRFDADTLLAWPPAQTVAAIELLATHGSPATAAKTIETVSQRASHRALLLVGAWCLSQRDQSAASCLIELLPKGHKARGLISTAETLPDDALDDLGDIRIRHCVELWLERRIRAARAKAKAAAEVSTQALASHPPQ